MLAKISGGLPRLVLSEENFAGTPFADDQPRLTKTPYPDLADRVIWLAERLVPHRLRIAFAVRNPVHYWVSCYSQKLISGNFIPWEAYSEGLDPQQFRWADVIAPIAEAGCCASILVWPFEAYQRHFAHIASAIALARPAWLPAPNAEKANQGLSTAAVDACAQWHAEGKTGGVGEMARKKFPISDTNPKFMPVSPENIELAHRAYREDLTHIAALPNVNMIGSVEDL